MRFATVNSKRQEANPGLTGECLGCGNPVIAKCGKYRMWHWAHKANCECDPWWENETEWHRAWKDQFPLDWQEIVHPAESGLRHIADVRTERGWVIEFQHSAIASEERRSRDEFYPKLVWVVDGTRRKRDARQLAEAVNNGARLAPQLPIVRTRSDEGALLREWTGSQGPVLFDFGTEQLWWLIAGRADGPVYLGPVSRRNFIEMHRGDVQGARDFDGLVEDFRGLIADYESNLRAQELQRSSLQSQAAFQRLVGRSRPRRRL